MTSQAKLKYSIYSTNDKPLMHFSGANGFPVGCYDTLLNDLSKRYSISSVWHKALWPDSGSPERSLSWDDYADDIIRHLKQQGGQPVVGIGHSMGATVTLIAAAKAPKLFSKIVLIEPVIISKLHQTLGKLAPKSLLNQVDPVKSALTKSTHWKTKEQAQQNLKAQTAFKRVPNEQIQTLINAMTDTNGQQYELTYSLKWEIANYLSARNVLTDYKKLTVPTAVIRARPSIFVHDKSWHKMMRAKPNALYMNEMEYSHLLPFEAPQLTRQLITSAIKQLDTL
jgi:pimeloyl-ACP methyl ester carboxylesterase